MKLTEIDINKKAVVCEVSGEPTIVRRLRDMGLVEGSEIIPAIISPLGDPRAYWLFGTLVAIRSRDADGITVICHG